MERLQKIIAQSTDYSRRAAEDLIVSGRVTVNGEIVQKLGTKAEYNDEILIDGNVITQSDLVYYLLNKPIRVISSRSDEKNRVVIPDLINESQKIFPVGRLDYFTTGLILVTNDGKLANGLMHPKFNIEKTYRAKVKGRISDEALKKLSKGIVIDNYKTRAAKVKRINYSEKNNTSTIELTISEGKNQQVRKMFATVGFPVKTLKRVKYAFFELENEKLPLGMARKLSVKEIKKLYNLVGEKINE